MCDSKRCRWCQEEIHIRATVCKHCTKHQRMLMQLFMDWSILISFIMMLCTFMSFWEARRERIAASEALREVRLVANNTVKMAYVLADAGGRWGGTPPQHLKKIKEYQGEIRKSLDSELDRQIKRDLEEINAALQSKQNP